ncbi:AraC family transcriptional regulator [Bordetella genomosp. 11]|uniref:AraC family transcriptional regulator n=1 Tax=Bordetella genomosp. 11 TaxID=1416808 RepID=A0A261UK69_9BORD|nr:AraC family transcriptional regulator [Bordetella genomosp. 11]OZI62021.1 AraC family transcriptional regulator [Bordetella genomosp. 11]
MSGSLDWLSRLLEMIEVTGQLEIRCAYGEPWRIAFGHAAAREIPYHVVLHGVAILEDPEDETVRELGAGDIIMLPHGSAHILHDGSGRAPIASYQKHAGSLTLSENGRDAGMLDMLCGRFFIAPPHDRLIQGYLPTKVVVRATDMDGTAGADQPSAQLAALVRLMRGETAGDTLGGRAMLNALSSALFTLTLRVASHSEEAPKGLLALAGHPRLAPALSAIFNDPARQWTLPELAEKCSMSRATFMRHFQERLGRSAYDLLTDVRMSLASNELKRPSATTESVAEAVGYQSVAAFRRGFTQWMGMTPGEWRRLSRARTTAEESAAPED